MTNIGFIITGAVSIVFIAVVSILSLISYGQAEEKGKKLYCGLTLGGFVTLIFITNALYELVV
jgi:hypothetical protein